jgi:hypothetical protein
VLEREDGGVDVDLEAVLVGGVHGRGARERERRGVVGGKRGDVGRRGEEGVGGRAHVQVDGAPTTSAKYADVSA